MYNNFLKLIGGYNELLNRKPTDKNESIINGIMWKHIGFQSLFEIIKVSKFL